MEDSSLPFVCVPRGCGNSSQRRLEERRVAFRRRNQNLENKRENVQQFGPLPRDKRPTGEGAGHVPKR